MRMLLDLTASQSEQLKPMFEAVRSCNKKRVVASIAAQIFPDGIHVKLMTGEKCEALATALGGRSGEDAYCAADVYAEGLERDKAMPHNG